MAIAEAIRGFMGQPSYAAMRATGRIVPVRRAVAAGHRLAGRRALRTHLDALTERHHESVFTADPDAVVAALSEQGIAFGLDLPGPLVDDLVDHAESNPCHADRDPRWGFYPDDRPTADAVLGRPVLVAQHFNALRDCAAVATVATDPLLHRIASQYLGVVARLVGVSLWWTFPVVASAAERDRHAHAWHRDLDDVDFLKFFFYLTDVDPGDGGHQCVAGSHRTTAGLLPRQAIRRHTDAEVEGMYPTADILEICGPRGTGFAETTLCLHKGRTPVHARRLLLQLEFAHFDYGVAHDDRSDEQLRMIVPPTPAEAMP